MTYNKFMVKFNFITNIVILSIMVFGSLVWADSNGIWTFAEDIRSGVFGENEGGGDYEFPQDVLINNDLVVYGDISSNVLNVVDGICIDSTCYHDWDFAVKSAQVCLDNKAVVGFDNSGNVICDYPNAVYS